MIPTLDEGELMASNDVVLGDKQTFATNEAFTVRTEGDIYM